MSGSASPLTDDDSQTKTLQMETELSVASIIDVNPNETHLNILKEVEISTEVGLEISPKNTQKRKISETENELLHHEDTTGKAMKKDNHISKKPNTRRKRQYNELNEGPFEIIVRRKDGNKINPFAVGKIIKNLPNKIDHIKRSGKNLTITCKDAQSANELLDSVQLQQYIVFIPANKVETTGEVYVEPDITEQEITEESNSPYPIVQAQRITRFINKEVKNTYYMKITFESDKLPQHIYLNYVRVPVEPYMIPVKQCFNCFQYGHVAKAPCQKEKMCRDCGQQYHQGQCNEPKKCVNCHENHSSNSKSCPEYQRQKQIMERISLFREDFFTASQHYPTPNNYNTYFGNKKSYANAIRQNLSRPNRTVILSPTLPSKSLSSSLCTIPTKNKYTSLDEQEGEENNGNPYLERPYNTKPKPPPYKTNSRRENDTKITIYTKGPQSTMTQQANKPSEKEQIPRQDSNAQLKKIIGDKIREIRTKVQGERIINKQKVDELLSKLLKELTEKPESNNKPNIPIKQSSNRYGPSLVNKNN